MPCALACFALNFSQLQGSPDQNNTVDGSPSMFFNSADPQKRATALTLMLQRGDLREIYCTPEIIRRREGSSVAVLDRSGQSREVEIGPSETVRTFLTKSGMPNIWRASWQPQARLITKNVIYQSPAFFDEHLKAAFLERSVRPGDILIITLLD